MAAPCSDIFQGLVSVHLLASQYRQLHLADVVGANGWAIELAGERAGQLRFPPSDLAFSARLLGSISYESHTWLWGWANAGVPPEVVLRLEEACPELSEAQVAVPEGVEDDAFGHQIAAVACGLTGGHAYYRGPTGPHGAAFFVITDPAFPRREEETASDALRLVTTICSALELGWIPVPATAVAEFLVGRGWTPAASHAFEFEGTKLALEVDECGRVRSIKSDVSALPA